MNMLHILPQSCDFDHTKMIALLHTVEELTYAYFRQIQVHLQPSKLT
jgi:hypothetical protein